MRGGGGAVTQTKTRFLGLSLWEEKWPILLDKDKSGISRSVSRLKTGSERQQEAF
jgi:hypothetical protein